MTDDVTQATRKIIPFNWPHMTGKELHYVAQAHNNGRLAGDGPFTKKCHGWLEDCIGCKKSLLTHSCTAALEMSALLLDIQPGDEIIMPSYTFVSTANAFVLRGGVPVFVDIRNDTLNLNENLIEAAITSKTRAIVPVHYAGVSCEMDRILEIARHHGLPVVEDAAQGLMSTYKGKPLGSLGSLGTLSFHETKNLISGEGGALLVNDETLVERAEVIREKGTNRSQFFRGQVDKYTWQEVGSSFLPGELVAAFLWGQLGDAEKITSNRLESWQTYHRILAPLEQNELLRRPVVPDHCSHNAHMYYVLVSPQVDRAKVLKRLKECGVDAVFHYIPLHSAPAGRKFSRTNGPLPVTDRVSDTLIRLPLWYDLEETAQEKVAEILSEFSFKAIV